MKSLAIVGASGHGKVVADLAELCGYQVIFFDDAYPQKQTIEHWPVVGTFNDLLSSEVTNKNVIVGIGDNRIRDELTYRLINVGFKPLRKNHKIPSANRTPRPRFPLTKLSAFLI